MRELSTDEKYQLLRSYTNALKTQLKKYAGKSFAKGSPIESKLHAYKRLKKLILCYSESKKTNIDLKIVKQIDSYYEIFRHKFTSQRGKLLTAIHHTSISPPRQVENSVEEKIKLPQKLDYTVNTDEDSDTEITEIGPTPQLNGRVLTIFDIQTSPEKFDMSPLKNKPSQLLDLNVNLKYENEENVFKTPSKPFLKDLKDASVLSLLSTASKKLSFEDIADTHERKTPKKNLSHDSVLLETPKYIKTDTLRIKSINEMIMNEEWSEDDSDLENRMGYNGIGDDVDDLVELNELEKLSAYDDEVKRKSEPSPLIRRTGRSLFQLHGDLQGLKRNLTDLQSLAGECNVGLSENEEQGEGVLKSKHLNESRDEEMIRVYDPHAELRNKVKTIKRSTKRSKLKTEGIDLKDTLEQFNIHALAAGKICCEDTDYARDSENRLPKETDDQRNREHKFDMEDQDSEDDFYDRKDIQQLQSELGTANRKGRHPLSNNFVRLKINRGNRGGRFKRRR